MDAAAEKRLDAVYHSCRQMPLFSILACFFPIALLALVPLSLVYSSRRKTLLQQFDGDPSVAGYSREKLEYLRKHSVAFWMPVVMLIIITIILGWVGWEISSMPSRRLPVR